MSDKEIRSGLQLNIEKAQAEQAALRTLQGDNSVKIKPPISNPITIVAADGTTPDRKMIRADVADHPLFPIFEAAILQAVYGKGQRHGGNVTPFLEQPWVHYAKMHGRAFLTGQAAKKLEEAASTRTGEGFETEVFGSLVYSGMSVLKDRGAV